MEQRTTQGDYERSGTEAKKTAPALTICLCNRRQVPVKTVEQGNKELVRVLLSIASQVRRALGQKKAEGQESG